MSQGLEIARAATYPYGVACAQRALGRIAFARDELAQADTHLNDALQTFRSMEARFEIARTWMALAELAHRRGEGEATTTRVAGAHRMFMDLRVPHYVALTEALAGRLGVQAATMTV